MVANISPADPPPPLLPQRGGVKNSTFSEHGHVAYQIEWNHECSNLQAHILSLHTTSTPGCVVKGQTIFFF